MIFLRGMLLALALALSTTGFAHAASNDAAAIARALERGNLIYSYDQAAWHSSDVMVETLSKARLREIRGWVVEPDGDALSVLYYGYEGETPYGVFIAKFQRGKVTASHEIKPGEARTLTQAQLQMAQARKAATDSVDTGCVEAPYNTIVVPPVSETASVDVYLLTPQMKTSEYPFGIHHLVTVGPDGKVAASRAFTKACLMIPAQDGAAGLMITHLLDPTPTEIHVWLSAWARLPVYVATGEDDVWVVTPDAIKRAVK